MKPIKNETLTNVEIGVSYYFRHDALKQSHTPKRFIPCTQQGVSCDVRSGQCSGFFFDTVEGQRWHDIEGDFIRMEDNHG